MPFNTTPKNFKEVSEDMEYLDTFLKKLITELDKIDWVRLFTAFPAGGGSTPPPQIPRWPP
jgi:hypothetical protein